MASEELTANLHWPNTTKNWFSLIEIVMAVRFLREVGLDETREYLTRFGFKFAQLPRSETLALGAGSLTPVQMAQGFSVLLTMVTSLNLSTSAASKIHLATLSLAQSRKSSATVNAHRGLMSLPNKTQQALMPQK